jgi:hypothetical protein
VDRSGASWNIIGQHTGQLGFALRPGSTYDDAKTVASFMNNHMREEI